MAVDFGLFQFAGVPRTATTWIRNAAVLAGLEENGRTVVHVPHTAGPSNVPRLVAVRHPCSWFQSYWTSIYPGFVGVDEFDELRKLINADSFDTAVRQYLYACPGWIGRMFAAYGGDVVIRVEDLPWSFVEFLESVGVERNARERCLTMQPMNGSKSLPQWNKSLFDRVLEAEADFIRTYEY